MGITHVGFTKESGSSGGGRMRSINHGGRESFLDLVSSIRRV